METVKRFTVTKDHIILLQNMYVGWNDCEYGAPSIDPKKPYGNSDVEGDIVKLLGFATSAGNYVELPDELSTRARILHQEMEVVLAILLNNLSIKPGCYERILYGGKWKPVQP
jgi:hypothetical protein